MWNVDHVLSSLSLCLWDVIRVEVYNLIETWKIARASQHPPTPFKGQRGDDHVRS